MYQWVVFLHLLAAIIWIGGMFFLALVLVPVLRGETQERRSALLGAAGVRFRTVGWVCLVTLLVTGVFNLKNRGFSWGTVFSGDVFTGTDRFGHILAGKLLLLGLVLAVSAFHDFRLGPASIQAARTRDTGGDPARAETLRRRASLLGRLNALLALMIVFLAVALVRGLPW
jgi:uncharacterized membrane protein